MATFCVVFQWIVVLGLLAEAIFATGVSVITMEVFHTTKRRTTFVGIICVIFGIILYGSPLSIMVRNCISPSNGFFKLYSQYYFSKPFHPLDYKSSTLYSYSCNHFISVCFVILSQQKKVIQTKSVEYMPFWICMAGFANGIVWAIYALLPFDPYVLVIEHLFFQKLKLSFIHCIST